MNGQKTEIEILGLRLEGIPATALLLGIWFMPFFAGLAIGLVLRS